MRFESRGGQVVRFSRLNGSGGLRDNDHGIAVWDITYRGDRTVEAIEQRNSVEKLQRREIYNRDATVVDFSGEGEVASAQGIASGAANYIDLSSQGSGGKSEVVRHLLAYDAHDFVIRRNYARDHFNTPAADASGAFGEVYDLMAAA